MSYNKVVRNIAVVGTGTIGSSWAALFLAHGFDVTATDPAPGAEDALRKYVANAWKNLTILGLSPTASQTRLRFTVDMKEAVANADFVQESGPEQIEFKRKLFSEMDPATPADSIIASSSSGLMMSDIQEQCKHPERCVIGHPFNPPHVIPLVEVVGGKKTSPAAIEQAISFYNSIGKKPIHVKKELVGHVANRLSAALYREVVYLVEQGAVSVADVDAAVSYGPGLRWGVMGPNLLYHLGGGPGGLKHFLEHLSGAFETWWHDLGPLQKFEPKTTKMLIEGTLDEAAGRSYEELARERDEVLLGLLNLRSKHEKPMVALK